jgi:hypothetical protein
MYTMSVTAYIPVEGQEPTLSKATCVVELASEALNEVQGDVMNQLREFHLAGELASFMTVSVVVYAEDVNGETVVVDWFMQDMHDLPLVSYWD